MELKYDSYSFTPILGWSISRYEVFDKCKRQYFFQYYSKFAHAIPHYKIQKLKDLTSVPLEIGNVVHDVLEAFLRRLQKSDTDINKERFFEYARSKTLEYFSAKTFIENYYHQQGAIDMDDVHARVALCLKNFLESPCFAWIFMKALTNKENWMIEPPGYGETRLNGLKAYCKMDFLFPVGDDIYILDWKTGAKNAYKHGQQLIGYAAAASSNFSIPSQKIFPKIIYLSPEFDEFEIPLSGNDFSALFDRVKNETDQMQAYCENKDKNIPKNIEAFEKTPSESVCRFCNFQELCFPDRNQAPAIF